MPTPTPIDPRDDDRPAPANAASLAGSDLDPLATIGTNADGLAAAAVAAGSPPADLYADRRRRLRRLIAAAWRNVEAANDRLFDLRRRMDEDGFDGEFDPTVRLRADLADAEATHDALADALDALPAAPDDADEEDDDAEPDRRPWYLRTAEDRRTYEAESGYPSAREPLNPED